MDTIRFDQIILGERGRTTYSGIEQLAESIATHGLIQPIVLAPMFQFDGGHQIELPSYGLDAGGRRYHALKLLGVEVLHHAVTSEPGRYGYVLKGEAFSTPLQRLMTEIAENLDREDVDWRDEVRMITKAWQLARSNADANGEKLLMRDFGAMLGTGYSDLQAAVAVHDDVIAHPERYKDVSGLRAAYSKLLKINADEVTRLLATKSLMQVPLYTKDSPSVSIQSEPGPEGEGVVIPLTQSFIHTDSIKFMHDLPTNWVDHIVTDPDYGVSVERLSASTSDAASGVHQGTIDESLQTTKDFIREAFRVIKDQGFCVLFYDLDHHEKLQRFAVNVGFRAQRWPLIWVKSDYRSNASPAHNFTKNIEYAMVLRKPNGVLVRQQSSCVFNAPTADTVRQFGHPFAKPVDLWKWIYNAIAIKGQTTYDPFLGRGSSACAAVDFGLRPIGSEIDMDHYSNALMNIQAAYKKLLGSNVRFS